LGVVEPVGCGVKLKLNFGAAAGVVLDAAGAGAAAEFWAFVLPNENLEDAAVGVVVDDEAGAALGVVPNPNAGFGTSVGLFAPVLLEPPPKTFCGWAVVAPNGEGLAPPVFENGDCVFVLPPNGDGALLLPNGDEPPNGGGAAVAGNADLIGSLFWLDVLLNGDEVAVLPNGEVVVVLLAKGDAVVVVGNDDLAGSLFWFEVFENPLKPNLGGAAGLVDIDSAGVVVGVEVVLELFAFAADANVVGCLKLNARGAFWDGAF